MFLDRILQSAVAFVIGAVAAGAIFASVGATLYWIVLLADYIGGWAIVGFVALIFGVLAGAYTWNLSSLNSSK